MINHLRIVSFTGIHARSSIELAYEEGLNTLDTHTQTGDQQNDEWPNT